MALDRLSVMALLSAALVSLASTCNVYLEEGDPEAPAWRDESAEEQMQEEQMDEVEEQIER